MEVEGGVRCYGVDFGRKYVCACVCVGLGLCVGDIGFGGGGLRLSLNRQLS